MGRGGGLDLRADGGHCCRRDGRCDRCGREVDERPEGTVGRRGSLAIDRSEGTVGVLLR